jgi:hypothetical protein
MGVGRQFLINTYVCRTLLFWVSLALPLSALADIAGGTTWLSSQPNSNGSFGNTPASLATDVQSTADVLRAYQALGQSNQTPFTPALNFLNAYSDTSAEYLARKMVVNVQAGNNVSALVIELLTHRNIDGGFGHQTGIESSVIDTAYALEALAIANYSSGTIAPTAVTYLLNRQQPNGGWFDGSNDTSVYLSALSFRALWLYRNTNTSVPPALTKARDFLLSQRDGAGSWGEQFNTALVLTALIPYLPDTSLIANSITTLQSAQLSNGSWANDPYTTALALQALRAAELRGGGMIGSGAVSGYVVKAGSGEAIAGATVSLLEQSGVSVLTNGDGYFLIPNLAGKGYTVTASKSGFSAASLAVNVVSGGVTLAGRLVLSPGTQGGFVNGKIFDATDLTALVGATVSLSGAGSYAGTTDAAGKFDLGAVAAGAYTVNIHKERL